MMIDSRALEKKENMLNCQSRKIRRLQTNQQEGAVKAEFGHEQGEHPFLI